MSIQYLTGPTPSPGTVTVVIDGVEYFTQFFEHVDKLKSGDRLYLMNWKIDWDFVHRSDAGAAADPHDDALLTKLLQAVDKGVDVRVMLWVNTNLFDPMYPITPEVFYGDGAASDSEQVERLLRSGPHRSTMVDNLKTVHIWRNESMDGLSSNRLRNRILVNTLDSLTGGCHSKFALILEQNASGEFEGTAYTGGIDFSDNRHSKSPHSGWDGINYWHDAMARVEGSDAVEVIYNFYRDLWNENVERKDSFNPRIRLRADAVADIGLLEDALIQCIPGDAEMIEPDTANPLLFDPLAAANTHLVQSLRTVPDIYPLFGEPEHSFAPEGVFEIKDALRHAFEQAQEYIYVEDQAMNSMDLFESLCDALRRNTDLEVVLITGADPADEPTKIDKMVVNLLRVSDLTDQERARLRFFGAPYTIHSKIYIVDDKVALVGSAGFITRSLTTELEHAVAFVDAGGGQSVRALRHTLWSEHTGEDVSGRSLEEAIQTWEDELQDRKIDLSTSTFTEFPDLQTSSVFKALSFSASVLLPMEASGADALTDDEIQWSQALLERAKALEWYLTWEGPFQSWLHPSQSPPVVGIPFIEKSRVAVNERCPLELISSQISTVTWQYDSTDGLPATGVGDQFTIRFTTPGLKVVNARQTYAPAGRTLDHKFVLIVLENSGAQWVSRFQTSTSVDDLVEPFRTNFRRFTDAVEEAGLQPVILSTYRPPQRAYLMTMAYRIARKGVDPRKIREHHPDVDISWVHYDSAGNADVAASRSSAEAMVTGYGIGSTGAAYPSRHSEGTAVDMRIEVDSPVVIKNASNRPIRIQTQQQLTALARSYGIIRLGTSNHWSQSGH